MSDKTQWYKALKPGTLKSGKFVKAGEFFQLGEDDVFTDTWMEPHEAPPQVDAAQTTEEADAEQRAAVRQHEEVDAIRRGKFSIPSVPRSKEEQEKHDAKAKQDAKRNPPHVDKGSASPDAPGGVHETSNNPSRIDENAVRKA